MGGSPAPINWQVFQPGFGQGTGADGGIQHADLGIVLGRHDNPCNQGLVVELPIAVHRAGVELHLAEVVARGNRPLPAGHARSAPPAAGQQKIT